jgi:RNA polymerase sigma-70 factor (ECF subfamily)
VVDGVDFEGFYREHLARVVRACALVTLDPSAAEEVAAEAFSRLWTAWGRIEDEDHAGGYVFKTAMRLCAKRAARGRHEVVGVAERSGTDETAAVDERRTVFAALKELPLRQRQTLALRDWAGFETAEVARMLGMRESTVRVHLSRAREAMRRRLSVEDRDG